MAKKHVGRFLTFAAIAGAAAAGISYFLQYKSFHKELDEEFHDFEDDFDEFEDTDDISSPITRNYVSLTPERKTEEAEADLSPAEPKAEEEEADESKKAEVSEEKEDDAKADTTVTVEEMTE